MSACSESQSTILPLPSSPHWEPTTTTFAMREGSSKADNDYDGSDTGCRRSFRYWMMPGEARKTRLPAAPASLRNGLVFTAKPPRFHPLTVPLPPQQAKAETLPAAADDISAATPARSVMRLQAYRLGSRCASSPPCPSERER